MIDLNELAQAIQSMSSRSQLYQTLKRELSAQGHWKNRPRGKVTEHNLKGKANEIQRTHAQTDQPAQ